MLLLGVLIRKTTKRTIAKKIFFLTGAVLLFVVLVEFQRPLSGPQRNRRESRKVTEKITATFDTQKGGVGGRLYLWEKGILLIKDRPVFGYGLDTHVRVLDKFNLEYARRFNYTGIIDRVHNNYLDLAIAEGLLGLTAYLIIIITFLVWLARTINAEADASRRLLYCGILSAACGYLLNDFFIFSVVSVSPAFWSLMGITISMKRLNGLAPHDKA
jgi:O-antigen ligase